MLIKATIQRVGGSTFARLPPEAVKKLGLHAGDTVQISILKEGKNAGELARWLSEHPPMPAAAHWRNDRGVMSKHD